MINKLGILFCIFIIASASNDAIPPEPLTSPVPIPTTSTVKPPPPTTSKSTVPPTTSKPTVPPTTSKPTVPPTTSKPTVPPSTSKPTVPPTTPKPTIPPTTPPPTPKPSPDPVTGNWSVMNPETNRTCILMEGAMQLEMPINANITKKINVPLDAKVNGTCGSMDQTISFKWNSSKVEEDYLEFRFVKMVNDSKYDVGHVIFADSTGQEHQFQHNGTEFETPLSNSYKCATLQSIKLLNNKNGTAYLHLSNLQLQAFMNKTTENFDSAKYCNSSSTPDVVPIVVGCILALLVVVVLAAYLIGRRRCQARGYLSM